MTSAEPGLARVAIVLGLDVVQAFLERPAFRVLEAPRNAEG